MSRRRVHLPLMTAVFLVCLSDAAAQVSGASGAETTGSAAGSTTTLNLDAAREATRRGNFPEAAGLYRAYVASHPKDGDARVELARVHLFAGETSQALMTVREVLEILPDSSDALLVQGLCLLRQKDFAGAEASFQQVIRSSPEYCDAHAGLLQARLRGGDLAGARAALEQIPPSCQEDQQVSATARRVVLAGNPLGNCDGRWPDDGHREEDPLLRPAQEAYRNGEYEQARELAARILTDEPEHADARLLHGYSEVRLGRFREAARDFEAVLRAAPDYCDARFALARVRTRLKDAEGARRVITDCAWCARQAEGVALLRSLGAASSNAAPGSPEKTRAPARGRSRSSTR